MTRATLLLAMLALVGAIGCRHQTATGNDAGADSDADGDADSETDTDTETCPYDCVPDDLCGEVDGTANEQLDCGWSDYVCCQWDEGDTDTAPYGVHGLVYYLWSESEAPGMEVRAEDQEDNLIGTDMTGDDGLYEIELPPGLYDLSAQGWAIYGSVWNVPVAAGVWVEVDIAVTDSD